MELLEYLETHSLTLDAFAAKVGPKVTTSMVSKWSRGVAVPTLENLDRIAAVTDGLVSVNEALEPCRRRRHTPAEQQEGIM